MIITHTRTLSDAICLESVSTIHRFNFSFTVSTISQVQMHQVPLSDYFAVYRHSLKENCHSLAYHNRKQRLSDKSLSWKNVMLNNFTITIRFPFSINQLLN